jgi:lysyl-tRNA synthetase, class I
VTGYELWFHVQEEAKVSWIDDLARKVVPPCAINDSKTPSGRAHVGALRGVLIHDVIYRHLSRADPRTTYTFGCDDYDALDELPHGLEDFYRPYLGTPLCNVPPPPGTSATDIADYYITEFFELFTELDVAAKTYRMRDLYRSGRMDGVIDTILRGREAVRDIYRRVNGSIKPAGWHPFQVICPNCGKIGTTIVTEYDGELVHYECLESLVAWAVGCGSEGWVSPFGGAGKLPWKLEWAARWKVLGVTVEGAGKDHTTKGGSRDVANAVSREILGYDPPLNQPYEFFLVGGSKMSSSKGIGASAAGIAQLLPPQLLRFLLIRTPARKALNFTPDLESITRLYADYDRMLDAVELNSPSRSASELRYLSRVSGSEAESVRVGKVLPWDTIVSLVQLPHVDFWAQAERRFDPPLSAAEKVQLDQRVNSARVWLSNYAGPEDKIELTGSDAVLAELTNTQRAFLGIAGDILEKIPWSPDAVQAGLFDAARVTPIAQVDAFGAIYLLFLGRTSGPRAGSLLAFLGRDEVVGRLRSVDYSHRLLIEETALSPDVVIGNLKDRQSKIDRVTVGVEIESATAEGGYLDGLSAAKVTIFTTEGRREAIRAELGRFKGESMDLENEKKAVLELFNEFVESARAVVPTQVLPQASS